MTPERGPSIEFGTSRHAPKIDAPDSSGKYDTHGQTIDVEQSREGAERFARSILESLTQDPEGTVLALEPSNIARTEQTRSLVVEELKKLIEESSDVELRELGAEREAAKPTLEYIQSHPEKKFIIPDVRGSWLIGFREQDPFTETINKWKGLLDGNEHLIGKLWAARRDELPKLLEQIHGAGIDVPPDALQPKEFGATPESQVIRQLRWMEGMKRIGDEHFPGRNLRLEAISHNLRSDYAALALLGHDISLASIDEHLGGEFRKPFERSSVRFNEDGSVHVEFKEMSRDYTAEEFAELERHIREGSAARLEEWAGEQTEGTTPA